MWLLRFGVCRIEKMDWFQTRYLPKLKVWRYWAAERLGQRRKTGIAWPPGKLHETFSGTEIESTACLSKWAAVDRRSGNRMADGVCGKVEKVNREELSRWVQHREYQEWEDLKWGLP